MRLRALASRRFSRVYSAKIERHAEIEFFGRYHILSDNCVELFKVLYDLFFGAKRNYNPVVVRARRRLRNRFLSHDWKTKWRAGSPKKEV
jgi:hypothetical protein